MAVAAHVLGALNLREAIDDKQCAEWILFQTLGGGHGSDVGDGRGRLVSGFRQRNGCLRRALS
jgi:hypothetical protein